MNSNFRMYPPYPFKPSSNDPIPPVERERGPHDLMGSRTDSILTEDDSKSLYESYPSTDVQYHHMQGNVLGNPSPALGHLGRRVQRRESPATLFQTPATE
jgi:hypothetical protein